MRKLRATIGHHAPSIRPVDAAAAPSVAHRREACATSAQDEQQGGAIEWQAVGQRAQRLAQATSHPAATRAAALDQVHDQARDASPTMCDGRASFGRHSRDKHTASARPARAMALYRIDQIRENIGSDTTVGDPDPPPGEAAEEQRNTAGRRSIRRNTITVIDMHRAFKTNTLLALVPGSNRNYKNPALLGIQLAVGPQPLWLRDHNSGPAQRIMVKHLATSPHDPLGITDSACKNQLVVVSVQYGPFNPYIPIRSTTIGKSRVARDPIAMHTSWRSNSDIASVTRTNQYNQDLGLIHSTNGNHLESPNEGSSIDHQVTIYLHAQNITMFPTMKHGTSHRRY
ncbi:triacylglycerol lipase [Dorcoceras hygrometricum]|uniref:Triacylglycerol lipase n=1 Tax=Dorcoceras hygrometricum TaxID=472368 RepID=A0A2Z7BCH9_9LAMI|nr:triacylglycerol lipase [Dorcoceras hygrometricum]